MASAWPLLPASQATLPGSSGLELCWLQNFLLDVIVLLNASSLSHPNLETRLGLYPRTVKNCWKEEFFPSSPVSCFSSGPVAFLSLWLVRIVFLELPASQGSAPVQKRYRRHFPHNVIHGPRSVLWIGETEQSHKVHERLVHGVHLVLVLCLGQVLPFSSAQCPPQSR